MVYPLYPRQEFCLEYKNESEALVFFYQPQSKLHFQAVFLGQVEEGRKRKIDSE